MAEPAERPWTTEEFFAWSELQPLRYELVNGRPLRMIAGANNVHDEIVVNILAALRGKLRNSGCRTFSGDGAVETYRGQIRRPDVGVDCGRRDQNAYKAHSPRIVVEVLSPSTRDFDSRQKLEEYKSVASLAHILFVEPNAPFVVLWSRDDAGAWGETRVEDLDASFALPGIDVSVAMREIYEDVEFPPEIRLVGLN
jgi:Uma2 family endonuclease